MRFLAKAPTLGSAAAFAWRRVLPSASGARRLRTQRNGRRYHRGTPSVDDVDDLTAVDPLQVDRGDPEVGMPELPLDHIQWDALSCHFNGVGVA
jgi:hypothetical protein